MNEFITEAIKIILALVAVILTRYAVPAIKAYLKKADAEELETLIEELVKAAEQLIKGEKKGEKKLSYVEDMLSARGIVMNDEVRAKVESAVYRLNTERGGENGNT